jgi:tetratricopeptide (TPR) repeat protein
VAYWQGDLPAAQTLYEESLACFRALGDPSDIARTLYDLSFVFGVPMTDIPRARALLEESLRLYERLKDVPMIARVQWALAFGHYGEREFDAARRLVDSSLEILRGTDDRFSLAWALHLSGLIRSRVGDPNGAGADYLQALELFAEARDVSGIAMVLDDLSALAVLVGDDLRGARLAGAASALVATTGTDLATISSMIEGRDRVPPGASDQSALAAAWAEGRALSLEDAVAYAMRRTG